MVIRVQHETVGFADNGDKSLFGYSHILTIALSWRDGIRRFHQHIGDEEGVIHNKQWHVKPARLSSSSTY